MRRVILNKGEQFSNKHLKRTGAFNARAMEAATNIIEQVREQGDAALRELTERFDGVAIENFRVPAEAIDAAAAKVDPKTEEALKKAATSARSSKAGSPCAKMAPWSARRSPRLKAWASTCPAAVRCIRPRCS